MGQKSYDERLEELQKRQAQLKEQERALRQRKTADERKKRTRRLIELGGIVESVLERETTDEDKIKLLNFLKMQERNGKYFSRAMNANASSEPERAASALPWEPEDLF